MSQHDLDAVAAIPTMISTRSTGSRSVSLPHTRAISSSSRSADLSSLCGKLCKSCQRLDLSVARFIVDTVQQQATNEVRNHYLQRSVPNARSNVHFASTTFNLGSLKDLRKNALECSFCELVKRGLPADVANALSHADSNLEGIPLGARLSATWELDGRARNDNDEITSRTRRLHLRWSDENLGEAHVVFLPSDRFTRPASDAPSVHHEDSLFLGRPIDSTGKNRALMTSWLQLCCDKHGDLCRVDTEPSLRFSKMVESSYFGVIDVYSLRLTNLPRRGETYDPYVALSYVWGLGDKYTTLLENVMEHRTDGGLERILHELPKAVQDAIALVPTLGIRYLWVDSLCIVQNSARSWKLNAFNMDLIYGRATLTICAADGIDSTVGLEAMHQRTQKPVQHTAKIFPNLHLMLTNPPESGIRKSVWNQRAWTFQERLLSPRSLIFVNGRVYFQCRSTGMSEDIVADREGAGWSLDLVNAPLQILQQSDTKPLWVYNKVVELYTRRQLTKNWDILAAFSGIYRLLEAKMKTRFIFGLPASHFDIAILWQSKEVVNRRKIREEDARNLSDSETEFSSWSWCGWENSPMLYDALTLDGIFRDANAWLRDRTWITWYVRDGFGDLRPLWDRTKCRRNWATEYRWQGYEAPFEDSSNGRLNPTRILVELVRDGSPDEKIVYRNVPEGRSSSVGPDESQSVNNMHREEFILRNDGEMASPRDDERHADNRDTYGRLSTPFNDKSFRRTLREFPYRVVQKPYQTIDEPIEHPLKPILQFHTFYSRLNLVPPERSESSAHTNQEAPVRKLERYSIADDNGDWCGSIVLDSSWFNAQHTLRHEFIAISDAMRFSDKECTTWTYYIPKEREESEWDVFYVLLIEFEVDSWKRVGLGKVFKEAFNGAELKEIILG